MVITGLNFLKFSNRHPRQSKGAIEMTTKTSPSTSTIKQNRGGLAGIVAATTTLSRVEGTPGRLTYHDHNIPDLARTTTFEQIPYLLFFGKLPTRSELVA